MSDNQQQQEQGREYSQMTGVALSPEHSQRIRDLQQEAETRQRSVLQTGIRQPDPSPVQFQENGTALVKGVLFTPREAARMLLCYMGYPSSEISDRRIDTFLGCVAATAASLDRLEEF